MGTKLGEKVKVTVTGFANCVPSGPKMKGVPTQTPGAGAGAVGSGVIVMVVLADRAPGGISTDVPSEVKTFPPASPITSETGMMPVVPPAPVLVALVCEVPQAPSASAQTSPRPRKQYSCPIAIRA